MTDYTKEVQELRKQLGGQFFYARFRKRDGTLRDGTFRLGVRKDLTGAGLSYNAEERGNLVVFDMGKLEYRTIRLAALLDLHYKGKQIHLPEED